MYDANDINLKIFFHFLYKMIVFNSFSYTIKTIFKNIQIYQFKFYL